MRLDVVQSFVAGSIIRSGEKSTLELRRNGVMAPAPRTKEMRERYGIPIYRTRLQDLYDEQGFKHPRVAFYGIDDLDDASEKMKQFGFYS
jgi:hypothetical protein